VRTSQVPRAAIRLNGGSVGGGWRRGGSCSKSCVVASVTLLTASSKDSSVWEEGDWTPLTFLTYWRAAASISSGVARGSRPRKVVMLRHMDAGYDLRYVRPE
jgi:hypothetical protein